MSASISFTDGEGITGWAVSRGEGRAREPVASRSRVAQVPGTPIEPESFICVPLIARGHVKGALNIYRDGEDVAFTDTEFELAQRFGDAAALALDNAEIRARLEHQARTDALTGLLNHSVFYEQLLHALQESSRVHSPVAVLMLDIDDFKHVNDVHGHAVGDELLGFLAEVLRASVRPDDAICRLGGRGVRRRDGRLHGRERAQRGGTDPAPTPPSRISPASAGSPSPSDSRSAPSTR